MALRPNANPIITACWRVGVWRYGRLCVRRRGAIESVVQRFGVFAPAVAAVVDAVADAGFGVLTQMLTGSGCMS